MRKQLLLILIILFATSCEKAVYNQEISYYKDSKTGVCFAKSSENNLAYIPCGKVPKYLLHPINEY